MLAGNPMLRSKTGMAPGICHRCLAKSDRVSGGAGAPCDRSDTATFPKTPCPGGIRATIIFPSCWDGKNVDSPDHQSHVAYAPSGMALPGDRCPSTHPVRIPQVMYEIMFDTTQFNDAKYWQNGKQPLVYSFGDPYVLCAPNAPLDRLSDPVLFFQYWLWCPWRLPVWLERRCSPARHGRSREDLW